ncbi:hypothetical protein BUALT_Bualt03G0194200 [Buddleja alternifolia]|uniref:Protein FAR1-RELATED SEQUENCE n=1 Tax=Buddleja alternifolia TaxID=168488 RepID=A0AAV6Y5Y0_9LAMI|nr:hypothetical protein BUALT_Bualt03G0194200 [Buddleja alternifolia]
MEDMFFNDKSTGIGGDTILTPTKPIPIPPSIGVNFECYEDAYDFYHLRAKILGFGVRVKNPYKAKNSQEKQGVVICCVHEGYKEDNEVSNPRPGKRIGCQAMMRIKLKTLRKWVATEVILDHNYNTSPSSARFYKSHKNMSTSIMKKLESNSDHGIRINKTYHSLMVQAGGPEKLDFDEKDVRNYIAYYKHPELVQGDAQAMYDYFCHMQMKNPNFFYLIDFDDEARLKNVFWADRPELKHPQDFVFLPPPLPFPESNYPSWVAATGIPSRRTGRAPLAIITDQCKAMQIAITQVFPQARHRLCLWHIMQKVPQKLNGYSEYKSIKRAMEAVVYDSLRVNEFEQAWREMIDDHGSGNNEWLQSLYDGKETWILVYLRDTFFAGMSTTQRSETQQKSEGSIVTYIVKERVTIAESIGRIVDYEVLYGRTEDQQDDMVTAGEDSNELSRPCDFQSIVRDNDSPAEHNVHKNIISEVSDIWSIFQRFLIILKCNQQAHRGIIRRGLFIALKKNESDPVITLKIHHGGTCIFVPEEAQIEIPTTQIGSPNPLANDNHNEPDAGDETGSTWDSDESGST